MRKEQLSEICAWFSAKLSEVTGRVDLDIALDDTLSDFGLSSCEAASLTGDLERWLRIELPPNFLYDHCTVRQIAGYVLSARRSSEETNRAMSPTATHEPIAIVGMACRFPGARNPDEFWELLSGGVDAISEVPRSRWDVEAFFDATPGKPGKMNTRYGGFIADIDKFDAAAFGISPREAERMDPQQRLLMEVSWEALEDAGLTRQSVRGSEMGVFVGLSNLEYRSRQFSDPLQIDAYAGTGNSASIVANRISYYFDLRGPSLTIDTACSSSLSAMHLACQSLRSGESAAALVGSVNLMLTPEFTIVFSQAGLLSPDGKCRTFDADANGYVRGEGAAAILLKTHARALADGDRIYGLIRASAI
ncbi:MAG TPA: type I polyketide synthase, partial [Chroococcales cyanobacterium]